MKQQLEALVSCEYQLVALEQVGGKNESDWE